MKYQRSLFANRTKQKTRSSIATIKKPYQKDFGRIYILTQLKKLWSMRPIPFTEINNLEAQLHTWRKLKKASNHKIAV